MKIILHFFKKIWYFEIFCYKNIAIANILNLLKYNKSKKLYILNKKKQ